MLYFPSLKVTWNHVANGLAVMAVPPVETEATAVPAAKVVLLKNTNNQIPS